jgi:hypothetical protein
VLTAVTAGRGLDVPAERVRDEHHVQPVGEPGDEARSDAALKIIVDHPSVTDDAGGVPEVMRRVVGERLLQKQQGEGDRGTEGQSRCDLCGRQFAAGEFESVRNGFVRAHKLYLSY